MSRLRKKKNILMFLKQITVVLFALLVCVTLIDFTINITLANNVVVTGISIDFTSLNLQTADTHKITSTISPAEATNKNIIWTSSDKGVALVEDGVVTGFYPGSSTITATTEDGSYTASCQVTVSALTPVLRSNTVRVKLTMNNPTTVPVYIDGNYSVEEDNSVSLPRQFYHVKLEGGVIKLYYGDTVLISGSTITLKQRAETAGHNNFLWIDNYKYGTRRYLGDMKFIISGNVIEVINHVYLEEYLWGVVPHEMSNSWPIEALKSQAIAARTYAVSCMGGTNYDFGDTTSDQVYKGYHPSNAIAISAVDATSKRVLQYDANNLVPTYYSASNGGYTETPYHTWGGGYELPFSIKYDPFDIANPSSPYEEVYFPVIIDEENPVMVSDNVSGTPNVNNAIAYFKKAIFDSNQLQNSGYEVTSVSDFEITGLLAITQHTYDSGTNEDHSRIPISGVNNCVDMIKARANFKVTATKNSETSEVEINDIELDLRYFDGANGDYTYQVYNMTSLRLTIVVPKYEDDVLVGHSIYQRRYGHGVGMSQRGAQQRANSGQTYQQILSFYYPESGAVPLNIEKDLLTTIIASEDNSNGVVVCNDYLSVREGPSSATTRIFKLPPDARVEVVHTFYNTDYHMINFGDKNYYVHVGYVTLDNVVDVTGVGIDATATIDIGATQTLIPNVSPADATNKNVTWKSNNTNVATVNASGEVTGVGAGTANITATTADGGFSTNCTVTVNQPTNITTLSDLTINDLRIPGFTSDRYFYEINVLKGVSQLNIGGVATDINSSITGDVGTQNLNIGINTFDVICTAQDGVSQQIYTIEITRETFEILSPHYTIDQTSSIMQGVADETSIENLINNISNDVSQIKVLDIDGVEIIDTMQFAGTGMKVELVLDGAVEDEVNVCVLGDVNGDGVIDIIDYSYVKLHIFEVVTLENLQHLSVDIDKNGVIDIIDYAYVKLDIFDVASINK